MTAAHAGSECQQLELGDRMSGDLGALDDFARELGARTSRMGTSRFSSPRFDANQETVERDLAKLVLAVMDLVRRLMERQAARRVNAGSLSDDEVERIGETFLKLNRRMEELRTLFGLRREDLDLSLGPIGDLLP